ncbi:MAG: dihydrofolate reductase [Gammaproteobacteria bacterium]|nr:dihydrofolate reductase [Gammaproteobacteria bacterium]MBT8438106.1 dihydrofolate reductase [Gammaproteobacteria bacterium]
MKLSLICAMDENMVIGRNNSLPWHLPEDLKYFKRTTMGKCIIMGRKTYESIGRPLPGRTNIIVTRSRDYEVENARVVDCLTDAIELAETIAFIDGSDEAFVIGGAELYKHALPFVDRMHLTMVHAEVEGDTFFPDFDVEEWEEVDKAHFDADEANPYDYSICVFERRDSV